MALRRKLYYDITLTTLEASLNLAASIPIGRATVIRLCTLADMFGNTLEPLAQNTMAAGGVRTQARIRNAVAAWFVPSSRWLGAASRLALATSIPTGDMFVVNQLSNNSRATIGGVFNRTASATVRHPAINIRYRTTSNGAVTSLRGMLVVQRQHTLEA